MKARLLVGPALGLLLAGSVAASSSATGSPARATGGGRFIYPSSTLSTIGFSAIGTTSTNDGAAQGQLNVVDQADSTKFHGYVQCLNVMGNTAVVEGTLTVGTSGPGFFRLVVTDNGQGGSATGTDMIAFEPYQGDGTCQNNNNNDNQTDLAHGNVQVTAAGSSSAANAPRTSSSTSTTTLRTTRSRHTRAHRTHRVRRAA